MHFKFNFHNDAGHGWLEAPFELLRDFHIADKISSCSYRNGSTVYLEEDCDAGVLIEALKAAGNTVEFVDIYEGMYSPCRKFPRYFSGQ